MLKNLRYMGHLLLYVVTFIKVLHSYIAWTMARKLLFNFCCHLRSKWHAFSICITLKQTTTISVHIVCLHWSYYLLWIVCTTTRWPVYETQIWPSLPSFHLCICAFSWPIWCGVKAIYGIYMCHMISDHLAESHKIWITFIWPDLLVQRHLTAKTEFVYHSPISACHKMLLARKV